MIAAHARRPAPGARVHVALALVAMAGALACGRGRNDEGRRRIFSREADAGMAGHAAPQAGGARGDRERPDEALALDAAEVAARLGSFEWNAVVDWSVSSRSVDARRVHVNEHHRLRQSVAGEFEVESQTDPGQGTGSVLGKHVIWAGGMTYARGEYAPWRERPTDRGRDARRFRDESFGLAAAIARLCGAALVLEPAGDAAALGRRAGRFRASLDAARFVSPEATRPGSEGAPDEDTARRLAFLDGHVPRKVDGEVLLDAETGVPLRVKLAATFGLRDQPDVRVELSMLAQVKAVGGAVAAVKAPANPLPDSRKPPGVAAALEAAGLKTRAQEEAERKAEPEDEDTSP